MTLTARAKSKKPSNQHLGRATTYRLGSAVLKAVDAMAKQDTLAKGVPVTNTDVVRLAIMERYRKRKVKRKE